ncbi:M14 family zinc carboxypeptidase [Bythopirellula goksoeyrii]|uniref:Zinc carboxypeptidase n=1 Tax=Bythopirellula goksoeyrii TaxID=1400387 RepID=A0A5B9QHB4_9BACT|nr:M14 family zinc carboxypeptidase [Bythopirellula goksoeyrii]QEG37329.1 Zinc carboxypeptidase [Bythopirellula goksoeyrii]
MLCSLPNWLFAIVCGVLISNLPAQAVITLDGNFDSGSLESYTINGNTVNITGRDSYAGGAFRLGDGHWRWLHFKASGVLNQNPTFAVHGEFGGDGSCCDDTSIETDHELYDHEMVYSYDGENWQYFPHANNTLSTANANPANDLYTFSLGTPFTQDEVYVAYALPYTYNRSVLHTQQVLASPWAQPTVSGNLSGVIGQAPEGVNDIGINQPERDLYAYRITNPATDSATPKRKAMFVTGQHASETLGIYTYEGLIDWLISDDPRAAALRDQVEVFGYPTLNASGRAAGLSRSMLQHPDTDSNSYWRPGPLSGNDWDSPERTEQKINGEAMHDDAAATPGNSLDLFVDFHSSVPDYEIVGPNGLGSESPLPGLSGQYRDDWAYITSGSEGNDWWQALRALQPNLLQVTSGTGPTSRTSTGYALNDDYGLNADMSVTFENQFAISRPISYYHDLGKNFGLAMYESWVQVANPLAADFDEDGDVDAGDLAAWQAGYGSVAATHLLGDADGDGDTDSADFVIWQRQFTGGQNPFSTGKVVPEPSSMAILLLTATGMLLFSGSARS